MTTRSLNVLLIEDNPDHAKLIQRHLKRAEAPAIVLERVERLQEGLERLADHATDAVLLDLGLPDSDVLDTLSRLLAAAPTTPVIVLTSLDDLELATAAVQQGAQDYLVKADLSGELLVRSIRYAIERKRAAVELERSNRELQQFAHAVAHDVKSPLSVVMYCCELLRGYEPQFDEETREFLQATRDAADGMANLVTNLLEYASVGSREKRFEPVDCEQALEQAISSLQMQVAETGATITHGPLPTVTGDEVQIRQLFQNLLCNPNK
jgi:two-component system, sensor histidine kinase and response regulator